MAVARNITPWVGTAQAGQVSFSPSLRYWQLDDVRVFIDEVETAEFTATWGTDAPTSEPELVTITLNAAATGGEQISVFYQPETSSEDIYSESNPNATPNAKNKRNDRFAQSLNAAVQNSAAHGTGAAHDSVARTEIDELNERLFGTANPGDTPKILDGVIPDAITRDTELEAVRAQLETELNTKLTQAQVQALINAAITAGGGTGGITGAEANALIQSSIAALDLAELIKNVEVEGNIMTVTRRDDSQFTVTLPEQGIGNIDEVAEKLFTPSSRALTNTYDNVDFVIPAENDDGVAGTHSAPYSLGAISTSEKNALDLGDTLQVKVDVEHRDTRTGQRAPVVTAQLRIHNTLIGAPITLLPSRKRTLSAAIPNTALAGQAIVVLVSGTNNSGVEATGKVFIDNGSVSEPGPGTVLVEPIVAREAEKVVEPVAAQAAKNEQGVEDNKEAIAENKTAIGENKAEIARVDAKPIPQISEKLQRFDRGLRITSTAGRFVLHSGFTFGAYVAYELDRTNHTLKTTDEGISVNSAGSLTGLGESYRKVIGVTARAAVNGILAEIRRGSDGEGYCRIHNGRWQLRNNFLDSTDAGWSDLNAAGTPFTAAADDQLAVVIEESAGDGTNSNLRIVPVIRQGSTITQCN